MNILYTCDNNYIWLMGISMISLFENNRDIETITVYLLGEKIEEDNKQIITDIVKKYDRDIVIIDVPQLDIPKSIVSARWPVSAFTRLYAGELISAKEKIILYVDCDTIINGSIKGLQDWDNEDKALWGVKDCISRRYKENIGMKENDTYVNGGVLLINLDKLRSLPIKDMMSDFMLKYRERINYADQDVLNGVFNGEIGVLPPIYNVMTIAAVYGFDGIQKLRRPASYYSESELQDAIESPRIIHFTTNMRVIRPWYSNSNHPQRMIFRKYLEISPWNNLLLSQMKFTSCESRIIGLIQLIPEKINLSILGFIHVVIKPTIIRIKAGIEDVL